MFQSLQPRVQTLERSVGVGHAVLLGLGSILGSGIFVAIALGTQATGAAVLVALVVGAVVATFNALSSAQLAAEHPVAGGTYAYGYRHLAPYAGFTAGWVFLVAKSLSASVAALGAATYLLRLLGRSDGRWVSLVAVVLALALTLLVAGGIRRSARGNAIIVGFTILALLLFVVVGTPHVTETAPMLLDGFWEPPEGDSGPRAFFFASALMFVAYTGYARIATLGEEIRDPKRNIPRAIIATLVITLFLYLTVTAVALAAIGPSGLAAALDGGAAPLETAARAFDVPAVALVVSVAAITAMLGVLLNLVLGLSRVLLAMSRTGDMPRMFAHLDSDRNPQRAVLAVGTLIAALALLGSVRDAWSLSAFAVLIYYALTNATALRIPGADRMYPRWTSWGGLIGTLGLAAFIEPVYLAIGLALLVIGTVWFLIAQRFRHDENA